MFNKRLKLERENKGLSQEKFAKTITMSRSSISMYERGEREPDQNTLKRIADYFDVSVDYLLGRTNIKYKYDAKQGHRYNEMFNTFEEYFNGTGRDLIEHINKLNNNGIKKVSEYADSLTHCAEYLNDHAIELHNTEIEQMDIQLAAKHSHGKNYNSPENEPDIERRKNTEEKYKKE